MRQNLTGELEFAQAQRAAAAESAGIMRLRPVAELDFTIWGRVDDDEDDDSAAAAAA